VVVDEGMVAGEDWNFHCSSAGERWWLVEQNYEQEDDHEHEEDHENESRR
jgi:hypothetical protein